MRAAVQRAVDRKRVVILDSLNNIKGYRYELWCDAIPARALVRHPSTHVLSARHSTRAPIRACRCAARTASSRYAMLHCDTLVDTCREWNKARAGDKYNDDIFEDLASRCRPSSSRLCIA